MFDIDSIKQRLPDYLRHIGAEPRITGIRLVCRCVLHEDHSPSFNAEQKASGAWVWFCHPCGIGGTVIDLHVKRTGLSERDAIRDLAQLFDATKLPRTLATPAQRPLTAKDPLPAIPPFAAEAWIEGVKHLRANPGLIEALATRRGWPAEWVQHLSDCVCISMPLYHGQRTTAFLVSTPISVGGRLAMRDIGYHARLEPHDGRMKASWRFVPNESEHGRKTPALPFVIGGSCFDEARLLIITGGQWDAITFAFAAGWIGERGRWPEGVCVIGTRGDSSAGTFLDTYGQFWPQGADCLLLPDGDASGQKWFHGEDSFANRLARLCRKVAIVACTGHKDFNDLYRAERIEPAQIQALLASHGMRSESGAAA